MAHAYDVYLRNRLTEFDIIIQNLPYRDGLIIHAKMYLDAMVNYLCLQKYIVGNNNTQLLAEIDHMLETVYEKFGAQVELKLDTELTSKIPLKYASNLQLATSHLSVQKEVYNTYSDFLRLTTKALKFDVQKPVGSGESRMVLSTQAARTLKTAFERYFGGELLNSTVDPSSKKTAEANWVSELRADSLDIFYLIAVQCEALLNLSCAADCEIWYSLGDADTSFVLSSYIGDTKIDKFLAIEDIQHLLANVNAALTYFVSLTEAEINLLSAVQAGLERYRKVNEVDPLVMTVVDDLSVEELDYVVLA